MPWSQHGYKVMIILCSYVIVIAVSLIMDITGSSNEISFKIKHFLYIFVFTIMIIIIIRVHIFENK